MQTFVFSKDLQNLIQISLYNISCVSYSLYPISLKRRIYYNIRSLSTGNLLSYKKNNRLVEVSGIEPLTYSLQSYRSPT